MTLQPFVSILINSYNYGSFLKDAIDSALEQTYTNFEVIVVDDGSTDDSREIILRYGSQIVPVLKQNEGQASAFNQGFLVSKGDIICLLDADDIFSPRKLELVVSALQTSDDELGWCFHPLQLVDANLLPIEADTKTFKARSAPLQFDVRSMMRKGKLGEPFVIPATSGMCFTRACLEKIIPMPVSDSISLSDSYIKFAAMGICSGIVVNECLALQRIHDRNLFTLRKDNRTQQAEIFINTAFYLHKNFPALSKFSDNLLATGLHLAQGKLNKNSRYALMTKEYLEPRPVSARVKIKAKKIFYGLREALNS